MCLILFAHRRHPRYALVLAANRDEFYRRPSEPVHFWPDAPNILAGRDRLAGGTWLGLNRSGRLAALTNYRDPAAHRPDAPSRGALVSDFLRGEHSASDYLDDLATRSGQFNGFNLLVGEPGGLYYHSNHTDSTPRRLEPGLYGLSNALLGTPWPKVEHGRQRLAEALALDGAALVERLLALLADDRRPSDDALPDTGIGLERERALAPIFIATPDYGTRSSSVVLIDHHGRAELTERSYDDGGERRFRVQFDPSDTISSLIR